MGYESKLYIIEKRNHSLKHDGMRWGEVIATYDLCKCGPITDFMYNRHATDCYVYADDGNTRITEDEYGKKLTEAPIPLVIAELEKLKEYDYRRIYPLLSMLQTFENNRDQWGEIAVLHYGH